MEESLRDRLEQWIRSLGDGTLFTIEEVFEAGFPRATETVEQLGELIDLELAQTLGDINYSSHIYRVSTAEYDGERAERRQLYREKERLGILDLQSQILALRNVDPPDSEGLNKAGVFGIGLVILFGVVFFFLARDIVLHIVDRSPAPTAQTEITE
jgi:hypothetical protein